MIAAGASVIASGTLVASPGSKQAVEIKADKVTLIGECDPETYPLQKVRRQATDSAGCLVGCAVAALLGG
jgi:aspartyl/asparaginyl-tRNA synthetase